jgi:hypothetical protein
MMDLNNLENLGKQVKKVVDERGGMSSVEEDAKELKDIASKNEGWLDKAKDAVEAVKDPGAPGPDKPAS